MSKPFPILYVAEADAETAILSSGVLAYLTASVPNAVFTVVGSRTSAPLFADLPGLERLIVLEREGRLDWIGLWNQLRGTEWGLIVDQRGSQISGRLRRQKRAVRVPPEPTEDPAHAADTRWAHRPRMPWRPARPAQPDQPDERRPVLSGTREVGRVG